MTLASGAVVTVLGRGSTGILQLGAQALLGRLLGTAHFGLWAIGYATVKTIGAILSWGFAESAVRFASGTDGRVLHSDHQFLSASIWLAMVLGLLGSAALFFAADPLAVVVFRKSELVTVLQVMSPAVLALAFTEVASAGTRLTHRMHYSLIARDLTPALSHVLLIAAAFAVTWRLLAASLATVVSFLIGAIVAGWILYRLYPGLGVNPPTRSHLSMTARFAGTATLSSMFGLIVLRLDLLLVGVLLDADSTGLYNAAVQLAISFAMILAGFSAIFGPLTAGLYRAGEIDRLRDLFRVSTRWGLYVGLPLLIPLGVMAPEVLDVVFGEAFRPVAQALLILLLAQVVNLGTGPVNLLLLMTGRERTLAWITAASASVAIVLGLLLIPRWGTTGAAVSTAAAATVLFGFGLAVARSELGLWPYDRRALVLLPAAVATGLATAAIRTIPDFDGPLQLLTAVVVSIVVFVGVVLLGGIGPEDLQVADALRAHLAGDRTHDRRSEFE